LHVGGKPILELGDALRKVAPKASAAKQALPTSFVQWDRAMRALPTEHLRAISAEVAALLGAIAGLSPQQMQTGHRALADELASGA
jgi:hypothetical protein